MEEMNGGGGDCEQFVILPSATSGNRNHFATAISSNKIINSLDFPRENVYTHIAVYEDLLSKYLRSTYQIRYNNNIPIGTTAVVEYNFIIL